MEAPVFENLDFACAKAGKDIAEKPSKDLENIVTSALAVLEEQGLYALFLYLDKAVSGNERKKLAKEVGEKLHGFLNKTLNKTPQQAPLSSENSDDIFTSIQKLAENLDKLLLARDMIRQSLVYARYHARVREESEKPS